MIRKIVGFGPVVRYSLPVGGALALALSPAAAQLSISSGSELKPNLMCKAWTGGDDLMLASGEVSNEANAEERFAYHAREYGKAIGKEIYIDCVDFDGISPEYRASFEPGGTFKNYREETMRLVKAPFLPDNWQSTPTPGEKQERTATDKPEGKNPDVADAVAPSPSKYVEVPDGNGGIIRLSPEVAARNQAAAEDYKRKMQEHAEAVARIEAEKQAVAAKRAEVLAKAAEEKREYERRLAEHAAQVAAQKAAVANREAGKGQTKGGVEVVSRLTGPYRKTREEALATLMSVSKSYPDVFDIKCERMAGNYYEEPWACWGSYREIKTRSSVSKQ